MPLYQRRIEPVNVGRNVSGDPRLDLVSSQEGANNRTFANIIRQLGCIGKYANDIFGNLEEQTNVIRERTSKLSERVSKISNKLEKGEGLPAPSLSLVDSNFTNPNENLLDLNDNFDWKSQSKHDGELFTPDSRPQTITEMYTKCDTIPNLHLLQQYRTDDVNCVGTYSYPGFFFEIWKNKTLEEAENSRLQRHQTKMKRRRSKRTRNVANPEKIQTKAEMIRQREMKQGNIRYQKSSKKIKSTPSVDYEDILQTPPKSKRSIKHVTIQEPNDNIVEEQPKNEIKVQIDYPATPDPDFPDPPPLDSIQEDFPAPPVSVKDFNDESLYTTPTNDSAMPFPPPPPPLLSAAAPPPPPPPPPPPIAGSHLGESKSSGIGSMSSIATYESIKNDTPNSNSSTPPANNSLLKEIQQGMKLKKTIIEDKPLDDRSDLLKQIREGKQLRKVGDPETRRNMGKVRNMNNVADVLASVMDKRFGKVHGDSDSSYSDDEYDSAGWSSDEDE